MIDVATTGPVGYRQFVLEKTCDVSRGHKHNYDHATFIHRGRVRITASRDDGAEITSREFGAGEWADIPANLLHTIKALEDNTIYFCIFSHRDFDGLVSQSFAGNTAAYS